MARERHPATRGDGLPPNSSVYDDATGTLYTETTVTLPPLPGAPAAAERIHLVRREHQRAERVRQRGVVTRMNQEVLRHLLAARAAERRGDERADPVSTRDDLECACGAPLEVLGVPLGKREARLDRTGRAPRTGAREPSGRPSRPFPSDPPTIPSIASTRRQTGDVRSRLP